MEIVGDELVLRHAYKTMFLSLPDGVAAPALEAWRAAVVAAKRALDEAASDDDARRPSAPPGPMPGPPGPVVSPAREPRDESRLDPRDPPSASRPEPRDPDFFADASSAPKPLEKRLQALMSRTTARRSALPSSRYDANRGARRRRLAGPGDAGRLRGRAVRAGERVDGSVLWR